LTANTVNGSGNEARSGAQTLVLLAAPLNILILRTLLDGPKQQAELRREAGSPAQTTLRAQLKRLEGIGAIEKHRRDRFPGVLEYGLTTVGGNLISVVDVLERWLDAAPGGPLPLGGAAAKAAVKALAEGWSTTMLRALAAGPLSLTELDRVIGSLSYPSLERRLGALRLAGLVEARNGNGRGTPYEVTDWLRRGIAPLAVAARWERRHIPDMTAPIGRIDAEAAFLLSVPLLRPAAEASGTCRMAVEIPNGRERRLAGVLVEVGRGGIASCNAHLEGHPDAWVLGPAAAWLEAVIEHDSGGLELGGDCRLGRSLLDGLNEALFAASGRPQPL
jgi:DNA-binding HxlR family transcriptional regulator